MNKITQYHLSFWRRFAIAATFMLGAVITSSADSAGGSTSTPAPALLPIRLLPPVPGVIITRPNRYRTVRMEVTAYCPCKKCCGRDAQGITASGHAVDYNGGRFVAADPDILPLGSRVSIPGYHDAQVVHVIDTGGAIKGNRLDVYFPSHEQAREWGRQWLNVRIAN